MFGGDPIGRSVDSKIRHSEGFVYGTATVYTFKREIFSICSFGSAILVLYK